MPPIPPKKPMSPKPMGKSPMNAPRPPVQGRPPQSRPKMNVPKMPPRPMGSGAPAGKPPVKTSSKPNFGPDKTKMMFIYGIVALVVLIIIIGGFFAIRALIGSGGGPTVSEPGSTADAQASTSSDSQETTTSTSTIECSTDSTCEYLYNSSHYCNSTGACVYNASADIVVEVDTNETDTQDNETEEDNITVVETSDLFNEFNTV